MYDLGYERGDVLSLFSFTIHNIMGRMKYITLLAQDSQSLIRINNLIKSAKRQNLNYCILDGEFITLEQAMAMVTLIKNYREANKLNDTLHFESD